MKLCVNGFVLCFGINEFAFGSLAFKNNSRKMDSQFVSRTKKHACQSAPVFVPQLFSQLFHGKMHTSFVSNMKSAEEEGLDLGRLLDFPFNPEAGVDS